MSRYCRFVIIGGGIAGLSAAEEIRKNSSEAGITVISSEKHLPYYRINLIRYLAGEVGEGSLSIHPGSWYEEKRIRLVAGMEASCIRRGEKRVELSDGTCLDYDRLILTAGAQPFVPHIKGYGLKNVVAVRTIGDARYLLEKIGETDSCICMGGGVLGLETAAAIAKRGARVTILESAERLMPLQLDSKAGALVKRHMSGIVADIRENAVIKEITGEEHCEGVLLETGEAIGAKLVIASTGIRPDISLAVNSGLRTKRGVIVNDSMQTSDSDIFAAGDMTEHSGIVYGLWNVAASQGKIAALGALGMEARFGGTPGASVLKVPGIEVFSMGETNPVDGDLCQCHKETEGKYYMFVLRKGRITGSIVIGDMALALKAKRAIESAAELPEEVLRNADGIIARLGNG